MTADNRMRHSRALLLASIVCFAFLLGIPGLGLSSEYDHHYQNYDALISKTCSSGTWTPITEYTIASTNFTPGVKYLVVINFSINVGGSNDYAAMAHVLHGTTEFSDSTYRNETRRNTAAHCGHAYNYWTVWDAVSGEDISVEVSTPGTGLTVRTEEYEAFVINLEGDLVENTDWFYQAATHSGDLPTTWGIAPGIGAGVTFDGGNDDWMILGFGRFLSDATSNQYCMRIYDVTTGLDYCQTRHATENVNDYRPHMIVAGIENAGSNHTVRVEAINITANTNNWSHSKVFALNLNKFKDHWIGYSTTGVSITSLGTWMQVDRKADYTASQTGDVLIWAQETQDVGENTKATYSRITVNGAVVPAGHSDAKRELPHGANDEDPHHRIYLGCLNAGSNDIEVDMNEDVDVSPAAVVDIHSMVIFSMEKSNEAPTLDWTGDAGYTTDGVDPDSALGGSTFEFRVEYTDVEGTAPSTKEVWVDLDDDGTYQADEKFDMSVLSGSDYTVGVDFTKSMAVPVTGDGTLKYKFYFRDGAADATGTPTTDHTFTVENNPPTLDWTGDIGYESDGVDPDAGDSGSSFEFRVEYTDVDDDAPATKELWIDLNDDNDYDDPGEKIDMTLLSGSDYTAGVDYSTSVNINHAGDGVLKYKFNFSDGTDAATGSPATDDSWYLTVNANNIPTLDWTGDTGYTTDGVEPNTGASGSDFEFRVEYTDADGVAPATKEVWVDLNDDNDYDDPGEKIDMTLLSGSDYTLGVDFNASIPIFYVGDGTLKYRFYFSDGQDDATGNPALDDTWYLTVNPNNIPALTWTGDSGYTTDGVEPDVDLGGSTFEFRVKYTDADNHPPTVMQVWIDLNDDNDYDDPDEKSDMAKMSGEGDDYTVGVRYEYSTQISFDGDGLLNYRFYFSDGQDDATGDPATNQTLTVTNNAPTLDWTGDSGFTADGVEPDSANSGSVFGFRVEFTDLDNLAPATKQVWIDLDDSASYEAGEKFDMVALDPGDTNYQDGKDYFFSKAITRAGDGTLDYQFYFRDSEADATGDPASAHSLVVTAVSGEVLNAKTFGGTSSDYPTAVQQTSDGGYVVAANTGSFGTGNTDVWVLKLNVDFSVAWEKTYGGTSTDNVNAMQQTQDGGYILAGTSASFGSGNEFWVLKLAASGAVSWQRRYSRSEQAQASAVRETPDGGYIVAGYTSSYTNPGSIVIWAMKLNSTGTVVWEYTYDGGDDDRAYAIECTADGGFVMTGTTQSFGAGSTDIWVLKLNSDGTVAWQKAYGGTGYEEAKSIQQTMDGGYIVGGRSGSFVPGVTTMWVLKLDANGNVDWQKTYSGVYGDTCNAIQQTADGGYIVAGDTAMGSEMESPVKIWLIKLQPNGDCMWGKTYGSTMEWSPSVQQTSDGGYITAGNTYSYGAGSTDVWVLRVDANGEIPDCSEMGNKSPLVSDTSVVGQDTNIIPFGTAETVYGTAATVLNSSATTSVQCTYTPPLNQPPVADAGDTQAVYTGDLVTLDASGSYDPEADYPLTYEWTMISKPGGSTAVLSDPGIVDPTFTADLAGDYTIQLVVRDSLSAESEPSQVLVIAVVPASNPPTLAWTGDPGYVSDGVDPDTGDNASTFDFRVEYTHPDNYPPTIKEVWIDLDDDGTYDASEKLEMDEVDSGDTNYQDGKDYAYPRTMDYVGDGIRKYRFYFSYGPDSAGGDPSLDDTWYFTVNEPAGPTYYVNGDSESPQPPYDQMSKAANTIEQAIAYSKTYGDGTGDFFVRKTASAYSSTSTIMIENNMHLQGRDETWNEPSASDYSDCPTIYGDSVAAVTFEGVSNSSLDGLVLTGGASMWAGIVVLDGTVTEVANATIRNCQVGAEGTTGWSCITLWGAVGATIEDCDIAYGRVGIGGASTSIAPASSPLVIKRNTIHDCVAGIRLYGGGAGGFNITIGGDSLDGNQVYENNYVGIYLQELGTGCNVTLDNNNIYENGYGNYSGGPGVYVSGPVDRVTIKRNAIYDNAYSGVAVSYDSSVVVVGADSTVVDTLENIQNLYGNDIYSNWGGAGVVLGNHETPGTLSGDYVVRGNHMYNQRAGVSLRAAVSGNVLIRQNEMDTNWRGGVEIQNSCDNLEIIENNIHNNSRVGIHTGDDAGTFNGTPEFTNLTIRQNKIHHNGGGSYGGGIDVRHATATIENNLVYKNHFVGIRMGDYTNEVEDNTVIYNGDVANEKGGGIIFDDLTGAINDPPSGIPTVPFPIQGNISAYNVRAGIRACFYTTDLYRNYNLLYSNNQDYLANWCGTCASPDCTTGGRRGPRTCIGAQLGRGCNTETPFCCTATGASGALPGETLIFADPLFEDADNDDYHLAIGSPAIGAGEGGTDLGAYGGTYPINDSEIPGP